MPNSVSHILVGVPSPPQYGVHQFKSTVGARLEAFTNGVLSVRRIPGSAVDPTAGGEGQGHARNNRLSQVRVIQHVSTLAFTVSTPTVKDVGC